MTILHNEKFSKNAERAIVIGGGISGLLVSRVLSDHYSEVIVLDKDDFPEKPEHRAGIPQSFQPHRLTPRGRMILDHFFPAFNDDLLEMGAPSSQGKTAYLSYDFGNMKMSIPDNEATFSRALLEWVLRERVKKIPNVHLKPKQDIIGLLTNSDKTAVTGVIARDRTQSGQEQTWNADLVFDASGSNSKLVTWLEQLGYTIPDPDILKVSLGYSTRHYRIPDSLTRNWDVYRKDGNPSNHQFTAVLSVIENQTAELLLWGVGGRVPDTKAQEFEQNVDQLKESLLSELLQGLEPIGAPRGYRISELRRHRFELMERWPSGLLVMGDALCTFDPIYGLGMTVAAIEAERVASYFQEQRNDPQPHFEKRMLQGLQDALEPAWWLNCVHDLQWPNVEYAGRHLAGISFAQKYMNLALQQVVSKQNSDLFLLQWGVTSLLFSPGMLFNPQMADFFLAHASDEESRELMTFLQEQGQTLEEMMEQIPNFANASFVQIPSGE